MGRALKVGVFLPVTEREHGGGTASWAELRAMALRAEERGFDSLWIEDHLLFRFAGQEPQGPRECWSILAALAAVTARVELGPLVSCTSFRNPALLAKMADTVDEVSGGRVILGLGAGWHQPEYAAFGYPFDRRVGRFEEAIGIVHGLLRHGHFDVEGTHYTVRDCELRPRGSRPAGPPIMIGSTGERMLGLLARYGDVWNAWARQSVEEVRADRALVDAALERNGRDPRTVARTVCLLVDTPMRGGRPSEPRQGTAFARPADLAEHLLAYAAEGIGHVQLWIDPNTRAGLEWAAEALPLLESQPLQGRGGLGLKTPGPTDGAP